MVRISADESANVDFFHKIPKIPLDKSDNIYQLWTADSKDGSDQQKLPSLVSISIVFFTKKQRKPSWSEKTGTRYTKERKADYSKTMRK